MIDFLAAIFGFVSQLLEIDVPGVGVTFGQLFVGFLLISISLAFLGKLLETKND